MNGLSASCQNSVPNWRINTEFSRFPCSVQFAVMKLDPTVMGICLWNLTGLLGISGCSPCKRISNRFLAVKLIWEHPTV